MARINIEECWWTDLRRSALVRTLKDEERADGVAVRAWRLAQEFWKHGRQLVPTHLFNLLPFASALLECGLAEVREGQVYVRGSSTYLDWIRDKQEAGRLGGQKSVIVRREKHGSAQPRAENPEALSKQPRSTHRSRTKHAEPSYSSSSSSSVSGSSKELKKGDAVASADGVSETIAHYCELWKARYHRNPPVRGKVIGQFKTFVKDHGSELAKEYISSYLAMPDSWFLEKRHDIGTLMGNLNKVVHFMATGKVVTKQQIRSIEEKVDSVQGTEPKPPSISEILKNKNTLNAGSER